MLVPKPALAKARQSSARHDHVHVGMMREGGTQSMENRDDADAGTQVLGVGRDGERGLGRCLHQQVVAPAWRGSALFASGHGGRGGDLTSKLSHADVDWPPFAWITAFKSASLDARRLRPSKAAPCSMAKAM
jgi:hypothetical protein